MPWTVEDPPSCAKNWTLDEKQKCVTAANAVLEKGGTDEQAIYACIHAAGKTKRDGNMNRKFTATQAEKDAQKARSRRYGIAIRPDGNVTKPGKWADVHDSQWGDPVNYLYPIPDRIHAANAKARFQQDKGKYDTRSRAVVAARINRLLRKYEFEPIGEKTERKTRLAYLVGEMQFSDEPWQDDKPQGLVRIPAARSAIFDTKYYGQLCLDEDLFESFIDNWKSNVVGIDLAVDRHHDPKDGALAWIKDITIEDGGLVLYAEPTSRGRDELGSVYKYASLEYTDDYVDPETGVSYGPTLLGCAATNRPLVPRQDTITVLSTASETRLFEDAEAMQSVSPDDEDDGRVNLANRLGEEIDEFIAAIDAHLAEDERDEKQTEMGKAASRPTFRAYLADINGNRFSIETQVVYLETATDRYALEARGDGRLLMYRPNEARSD